MSVLELPRTAAAASTARRALEAADGALSPRARDDVLLLLTEIVSNAVMHSEAEPDEPLRVEIALDERRVKVAVFDRGVGFVPVVARPDRGEDGGWGLLLVDRVADAWGVASTRRETCVWFEVGYEA